MNEPGGGSTGYNVMQPLGTDHFFSNPKSMHQEDPVEDEMATHYSILA